MDSADRSLLEEVVLLDYFEGLADPRQAGKVRYPLKEILLVLLVGVLAGADTFTGISEFGVQKLQFLRRFLPFSHGVPPHDRLGEVMAALDPVQFQSCFAAWIAAVTGIPQGVIAVDGKTSRRSRSAKSGAQALHTVCALAAEQRVILGQVSVAAKSNEIVAIPRLLDLLDIRDALVTIDAMGCQRDICSRILEKGGGYLIALKGNQGALRSDVELFVSEQRLREFQDTSITRHTGTDGGHGRIETRTTMVVHDVSWIQERHQWPGLKAIVVVDSVRETDTGVARETRYYVTSSPLGADQLAGSVRSHWAVESMHWTLDVIFRDDDSRVRTGNAGANFTTIKHAALNLLRRSQAKGSLTTKRLRAGWSEAYLAELLAP